MIVSGQGKEPESEFVYLMLMLEEPLGSLLASVCPA